MKKIIIFGWLVLATTLALLAASACSGEGEARESGTGTLSLEEGYRLLREHVEGLQDKAYVARIYLDGQHIQTYYQDGGGNWRVEHAQTDVTSDQGSASQLPSGFKRPEAMIYNARESKAWVIVGATAYEISDPEYIKSEQQFAAPITVAVSEPKTGHYSQAGENGIWEWRISEKEQANQMTVTTGVPYEQLSDEENWSRLEFQGPEGLLSRMSNGPNDYQGRPLPEKTYDYSQVGDVEPNLFELPASVEEVKSFEEYIEQLKTSGWMPSD